MKPKIHFYIVGILTLFIIGLHYSIQKGAYDFSGDLNSQKLTIATFPLTVGTFEERCIDDFGKQTACRQIKNIKKGDILVTKSSFTLFYRHGHVGLVVDAEQGLVLEALGYGNVSTLESIEKWMNYPTLKVLRLRERDEMLIEKITTQGVTEFLGIPYSIFASGTSMNRTHCSALIWKVFFQNNIDLNSTGKFIITPQSIANSPYLKVVAAYGFGTNQQWE